MGGQILSLGNHRQFCPTAPQNQSKSNLTRYITPKRVTSWRAYLRVIAPGQPSFFRKVSQRRRAVGNVVSNLTSDLSFQRRTRYRSTPGRSHCATYKQNLCEYFQESETDARAALSGAHTQARRV